MEFDHVHQGESHHVQIVDAAAVHVFGAQGFDHLLVILVVRRIAEDALDLPFQFARLVGELWVYFSHLLLSFC